METLAWTGKAMSLHFKRHYLIAKKILGILMSSVKAED